MKKMHKLFSLDSRLALCAEYVRKGSRLADIGTDHAYLPVWLCVNKIITSAIAADIRPMPLKSGADNIEKYGCTDIVSTRLSDGLDDISGDEVDDVVLAGMGGELIANIISRAQWLKDPDKRLILQPMTKAHILRKYLCENGFDIAQEKACAHGGKNYSVILAVYDGKQRTKAESFYFMGKLEETDTLAQAYMRQILKKLKYKSDGKKHSGEDSSEIDSVIEEIKSRFGVDTENDNC